MRVRNLTRTAGMLVLVLVIGACTGNGGQEPKIIAATDAQVEPASEQSGNPAAGPDESPASGEQTIESEPAAAEATAATAPTGSEEAPADTEPADGVGTEEQAPAAGAAENGGDGAASAASNDAAVAEQAPAADGAVTVEVAAATPSAFVDSYRLSAQFKIVASNDDGIVDDTDITAVGAWKRADNAFGFDASFRLESIDNDVLQVIEYVMQGDHVALREGDGWTTSPRGAGLPLAEPVAMLDVPFAGALSLGAEVGTENVAGVPTIHYRIDNAEEFVALVTDAFGGRAGTLSSITLDSWIARDGYVVKYLLSATTTGATLLDRAGADQIVDQTIAVAYAMNDINAVEEIPWPADAPPADALTVPGFDDNAFPLPQDAQLQPSVGAVAFLTALPEAEIKDFYAQQLGAAGWSFDGEYGYYTAQRDNLVIGLAVTAGEGDDLTRVEVFAAPQE